MTAFRPHQLVQTMFIPKQQPDICFPVNDDHSVSVQLTLGFSVSGNTSSMITQQSSLPIMKRISPSKHMELVNACRFHYTCRRKIMLHSIKSSSSEKSSLAINKRLMAPQDIYPSYKDVLATQVNGPMKKGKKRPKRIEFGQVAAEQLNEPTKKKRKAQKKIKRGPIVKNEVTEQLESCIRETIKGSDLQLVIQKPLYTSDILKSQNRLNIPINQLETKDFLTDKEKTDLENGKEIVVPLLGPTLRMYDEPMKLKIWPMGRTHNYVLMNKWYNFVEANKEYLKHLSTIQLWSFRVDHQLCFVLAVVDSPLANGVNKVSCLRITIYTEILFNVVVHLVYMI